ncbi:MAG: class I SAM-dependent methyltransferase [Chitinophagales bacterium]|nr:class I SAM-dependent methyltransferase [Bacteroidota bacterium]MCB9043858.1 class I SAM-dependent methyltransferase [Chitinophagales bacterium]
MTKSQNYQPEKYWSEVGQRIKARENGKNVIAGDDEPYYRYKREKFLTMLKSVDFSNKSVLEIGCGPGGNLLEVAALQPKTLVGADISSEMVALARNKVPKAVEVIKIDGQTLPFPDQSFDIVFTATVLQHNTNETMLKNIMAEIARVAKEQVLLFERIENEVKGDELCLGRPVQYYANIMQQHGFSLQSEAFINIRTSYYVSGAIRKGLNSGSRQEGEPLNTLSTILQQLSLPITRQLDKIFPSPKDIARLTFVRK